MRASLLKDTLRALISIQRPVVIEGPPGGGKTSIVHDLAAEMELPVVERHMPVQMVEDFGIPAMNNEEEWFGYKMPDWFPYKGKPGTEGGGILLFDDRNQAGADIQKVLANIMQARNLHGVPLADGWAVVSTGNRQSDRAGANRVLSHLRNRETVLELETHLDDSTMWMLDNNVATEVISFIRFRPHLLHDFDPQRDVNPTPRSWVDGVSKLLGVIPAESEYETFKGAIGEGAAAEFVGFMKIFRKLPNPDAILMNPDTSEVPEDVATLYALAGALMARITKGNIDRAMTYLGRMPPEFAAMTVSALARRDSTFVSCASVIRWMNAHEDVLT